MPVDNEDQIIRASFISLPRASDIPGVVAREHVFAVYTLFWKVGDCVCPLLRNRHFKLRTALAVNLPPPVFELRAA